MHLSILLFMWNYQFVTEMWYQMFLWSLFSSILVHFVASAIAFGRLRKHKIGRFIPAVILVMGFLSPITGGVVTSKIFTIVRRLFLKFCNIFSKWNMYLWNTFIQSTIRILCFKLWNSKVGSRLSSHIVWIIFQVQQ